MRKSGKTAAKGLVDIHELAIKADAAFIGVVQAVGHRPCARGIAQDDVAGRSAQGISVAAIGGADTGPYPALLIVDHKIDAVNRPSIDLREPR